MAYYVLCFMHVATRRVHVAGGTPHPDERWTMPAAQNVMMADVGVLSKRRYLIHDRAGEWCPALGETVRSAGVKPIKLPAQSLNLSPHCRDSVSLQVVEGRVVSMRSGSPLA